MPSHFLYFPGIYIAASLSLYFLDSIFYTNLTMFVSALFRFIEEEEKLTLPFRSCCASLTNIASFFMEARGSHQL